MTSEIDLPFTSIIGVTGISGHTLCAAQNYSVFSHADFTTMHDRVSNVVSLLGYTIVYLIVCVIIPLELDRGSSSWLCTAENEAL